MYAKSPRIYTQTFSKKIAYIINVGGVSNFFNKYKIFLYIIKRTTIVNNDRLETALYNVKLPKKQNINLRFCRIGNARHFFHVCLSNNVLRYLYNNRLFARQLLNDCSPLHYTFGRTMYFWNFVRLNIIYILHHNTTFTCRKIPCLFAEVTAYLCHFVHLLHLERTAFFATSALDAGSCLDF